jgi:hypothetical protein
MCSDNWPFGKIWLGNAKPPVISYFGLTSRWAQVASVVLCWAKCKYMRGFGVYLLGMLNSLTFLCSRDMHNVFCTTRTPCTRKSWGLHTFLMAISWGLNAQVGAYMFLGPLEGSFGFTPFCPNSHELRGIKFGLECSQTSTESLNFAKKNLHGSPFFHFAKPFGTIVYRPNLQHVTLACSD